MKTSKLKSRKFWVAVITTGILFLFAIFTKDYVFCCGAAALVAITYIVSQGVVDSTDETADAVDLAEKILVATGMDFDKKPKKKGVKKK